MKKPLLAIALVASLASVAYAQNYALRHGSLRVDDDHLLFFNDKPVWPKVQGNNSLTFIDKWRFGNNDVVLVQDNGGTACPASYHFVTTGKWGAKSTPAFGSCSDLIKVTRKANTIRVDMPSYTNRNQSEETYRQNLNKRYIYVFKNGKVTESIVPNKSKR